MERSLIHLLIFIFGFLVGHFYCDGNIMDKQAPVALQFYPDHEYYTESFHTPEYISFKIYHSKGCKACKEAKKL